MTERLAALGLLALTTFGCRSEAAPERTTDTSALAALASRDAAVSFAPAATDDDLRPPEWTVADAGLDEVAVVAPPVAASKDVFYNDLHDGAFGDADGGADAAPFVARVADSADDSVAEMLARYPFFPIRAHGLPAVSADGATVALIAVKPSTIGHGAEFDLDLYDVARDRVRTRVVLWSYAEEDAREDLNDSIGTATAAVKRMDGRMSRANALLRATTPSWQPLGAMASASVASASAGDDQDDVETYFGMGLLVTVTNGKAHVTNMHTPGLRAAP